METQKDQTPETLPVICQQMAPPLFSWKALGECIPPIEWLWYEWLPKGFVTLLTGQSGDFKSALALRIAMSIILGMPWPDNSLVPSIDRGKVLWCETEAANVIHYNRAMSWGEDTLLEGMVSPYYDLFAEPDLVNQMDLATIREKATHPEIRLVIIDSLSGSNPADENAVESAQRLKALGSIAQATNKPFLVTHHFKKNSMNRNTGSAIDRVRGTSAFAQHSRVIWAIDSPQHNNRDWLRLSVIKSNLSSFPDPIGMKFTDSGIVFNQETAMTSPGSGRNEQDKAIGFLLTVLQNGQSLSATEVERLADEAGISSSTLGRAKTCLGVRTHKEKGGNGKWYWRLPESPEG